nr:hypothetical protein Iba_scaffold2963CG0010 [Ipomoea batatas]
MAGRWTPSKQSAGFTATCTRSSAIAAAWRTVKEEGNVGYRGGKSPEEEQRRCRSSLRRTSPITRGKSADATPVACIPSDDDHATRVVHLAGERGNRGSYYARRRGRVTERSTPLRRSATDEGQCPALSLPSSAVSLHPLPPRRTEKRRIAEACCWRLHRDTHLWLPELHLAADVGAMLHWDGKTKKSLPGIGCCCESTEREVHRHFPPLPKLLTEQKAMAGRWTPSKQSAGFTATCTRSSAIAAAWRTVKEEGNVGYRGGKSPEEEQRRCRSSLRRTSSITRGKSADATPVACIPSDDDHATRVVHLAGERGNRGSYSARRRGRVTERSTPLRRSATDEGQCPALSLPSTLLPTSVPCFTGTGRRR